MSLLNVPSISGLESDSLDGIVEESASVQNIIPVSVQECTVVPEATDHYTGISFNFHFSKHVSPAVTLLIFPVSYSY